MQQVTNPERIAEVSQKLEDFCTENKVKLINELEIQADGSFRPCFRVYEAVTESAPDSPVVVAEATTIDEEDKSALG